MLLPHCRTAALRCRLAGTQAARRFLLLIIFRSESCNRKKKSYCSCVHDGSQRTFLKNLLLFTF